eukprot:g36206.t1
MVPVEAGQGRGGAYVSGGCILLEVVEMTSDDLLDVDAGAMVDKDKGNSIAVAEQKRGLRAEVQEMGWTWTRALSTTMLGNPWLRKKVDVLEAPLSKRKMRGVKREVAESEDELGQAEEVDGGWGRFRPLLQEKADSPKTLLVGDGRIKGLHIHGKDKAVGGRELVIPKRKCQRNHRYAARAFPANSVFVPNSLNVEPQVDRVVKKAFDTLAFI